MARPDNIARFVVREALNDEAGEAAIYVERVGAGAATRYRVLVEGGACSAMEDFPEVVGGEEFAWFSDGGRALRYAARLLSAFLEEVYSC